MNEPRLPISILETKRLFHNLRADVRTLYDEIFTELYPPTETDENLKETRRQESWKAVEDELRMAYEMSRFGLDVQGLDGYQDDVEIFKLNCEDIDGMDPLDSSLFNQLSREQTELEDMLQYNAMCRRSMPVSAKDNFQQHMVNMRAYYDTLDNETNAIKVEEVAPKRDILNGVVQPEDIGKIAEQLRNNLDIYREISEVVPENMFNRP